jgi:hypothetical protein
LASSLVSRMGVDPGHSQGFAKTVPIISDHPGVGWTAGCQPEEARYWPPYYSENFLKDRDPLPIGHISD